MKLSRFCKCWCFVFSVVWLVGGLLSAQDSTQVAPTDPLPASLQRKQFHLPDGFEIQLIVDESSIGQPMNLNFDDSGRLWISHSVEYPYPVQGEHVQPRDERFGRATAHMPRDRVTIVEGIAEDGTPTKIWDYCTGLNIPIGLTPVADGALIYSIPNIEHVARNSTGETSRTKLFGPFGNVDTHGMTNSFVRWVDGWVYACHGFRNDTTITGTNGATLQMNSGNVYRFQETGVAVESFTRGQVNPFGLTFDEWGNLYSADCHSKPLTLLLRGAHYSSFGKPHDGLGFGPDMIDHSHGSTGICGPTYYAATHFPAEYRENIFLCNPVTGKIHRDRLREIGSTRLVETQPDFITCDDPWFRPVDLKLGPDGALYIADFYNAVIGHYEVPLEHPSRDRTHGRVWRVVYRGNKEHAPLRSNVNLNKLPVNELASLLGDPNLLMRMLATNALVDRKLGGNPEIRQQLMTNANSLYAVHATWVLERSEQLDDQLIKQLSEHSNPQVRTHLARVLAERTTWNKQLQKTAMTLLNDDNAFVQRVACDAIGRHPDQSTLSPLVKMLTTVPAEDTHLRHTLRIALKQHLSVPEILLAFPLDDPTPAWREEVMTVLLAVPNADSATALMKLLNFSLLNTELNSLSGVIEHVMRYGGNDTIHQFIAAARRALNGNLQLEAEVLSLIEKNQKTQKLSSVREWALAVSGKLLQQDVQVNMWQEYSPAPAWKNQTRISADGESHLFFSSLPLGEQRTGRLTSTAFEIPKQLSFYIAGHCGFPKTECHGENRVVLRDAVTRQIIKQTTPPRNDTARHVSWDLTQNAGQVAYLELIDGDAGGAYAWLAVGRFSVEELNPKAETPTFRLDELVAQFHLNELQPKLIEVLADQKQSEKLRTRAARAVLALNPDVRLKVLLQLSEMPLVSRELRHSVFRQVVAGNSVEIDKLLSESLNLLSEQEQLPLIETLLSDQVGGNLILKLMEAGKVSSSHLQVPTLRERLLASNVDQVQTRVNRLLQALPPHDAKVRKRIDSLARGFGSTTESVSSGEQLFIKQCAVCHKIGTKGNIVGPQLDGIGRRGLERLLQDVLDPNQNVDGAFRVSTLALNDGRVLTGLLRRTAGDQNIYADQKGKEFAVSQNEIEIEKKSSLSLMPANLTETMTDQDVNNLISYLLQQQ